MLNTIDVSPHEKAFLAKIADRSASIAVIGLGYVGLPLLLGFHKLGFNVIGFDTDQAKIDALAKGKSYIGHIPAADIEGLSVGDRYVAGTDPAVLSAADAILICVPTPLTAHREPDLTYVRDTARTIAPHLHTGQLVVLESTTYPGTTREELLPLLAEGSGLKSQEDIFIAFSPEREDPGNPVFSTTKIPKVVGAEGSAALNMAGGDVRLPGVLAINVLDTLGLVSSSFGQWWGGNEPDGVELVDEGHQRYLSLQFHGDVLIGATAIGLTQHVGVLRGLIQNKTPLGEWKAILQESPLRFPEAYVARSQQPTALVH